MKVNRKNVKEETKNISKVRGVSMERYFYIIKVYLTVMDWIFQRHGMICLKQPRL